jgi:hypothetical protein
MSVILETIDDALAELGVTVTAPRAEAAE